MNELWMFICPTWKKREMCNKMVDCVHIHTYIVHWCILYPLEKYFSTAMSNNNFWPKRKVMFINSNHTEKVSLFLYSFNAHVYLIFHIVELKSLSVCSLEKFRKYFSREFSGEINSFDDGRNVCLNTLPHMFARFIYFGIQICCSWEIMRRCGGKTFLRDYCHH